MYEIDVGDIFRVIKEINLSSLAGKLKDKDLKDGLKIAQLPSKLRF